MKILKNVPIIVTEQLDELKQFYTGHFGFRPIFDSPGFLCLQSADGTVEFSLMRPEQGQPTFSPGPVTFCFEVDDPDAEHDRLRSAGVPVERELQDNPWGDRSFAVNDPIGLSIYLYKPIPQTGEWAQYVKE